MVVNDSRSSWADVTSGIPQGNVLGPMLFIIYINDMPSSVLSSIYLFADDPKLYRNMSSNDNPPTLQHDLQQLEKWSEKWQLRFNLNKCKVMHLGRQNPRPNYTMGGTTLATTTSEKDLGVYVDTTTSGVHTSIQITTTSHPCAPTSKQYRTAKRRTAY